MWRIWIKHFDKNGRSVGAGVYPRMYMHRSSAIRRAKQVFGKHGENPAVEWIVSEMSPFLQYFSEFNFIKKSAAKKVLKLLKKIIDTYGVTSIADAKDLVDRRDISNTDNKYGWANLDKAEIVRDGRKWVLKLPRPLPIE